MIKPHHTGALVAMVLLLAAPGTSIAKTVKPGLYDVDGKQDICLVEGGTWYSPTLANWTGNWEIENKDLHIWGNYLKTGTETVNDSIIVKGKNGSWTEWSISTGDVFQSILDPITFTSAGKCPSTAPVARPGVRFPSRG
jgi:hypothetical protein